MSTCHTYFVSFSNSLCYFSSFLVGQDCYTRIWSLHDARLLRTIPSPCPTSKANIPSVAFSPRLGGSRGAPGLLMAVQQDLYCFAYSSSCPDSQEEGRWELPSVSNEDIL